MMLSLAEVVDSYGRKESLVIDVPTTSTGVEVQTDNDSSTADGFREVETSQTECCAKVSWAKLCELEILELPVHVLLYM